jgi:hypothetical protein
MPQWLQCWLLSLIRLVQPCTEREDEPADPRHILQRKNDIPRVLTQDACRTGKNIYFEDVWCSTAGYNALLDDIVLIFKGLVDDVVRRGSISKHTVYESFMHNIELSAKDALFTTRCGFVGWARYDLRQSSSKSGPLPSHSVRKGDIIVVPRGASMPWFLRETDAAGEYRLITDCAVPGIMSGELMSLVESGQLQTQRYTLV